MKFTTKLYAACLTYPVIYFGENIESQICDPYISIDHCKLTKRFQEAVLNYKFNIISFQQHVTIQQ